MPPKKIPTNDLDLALMALGKSKSALPRFLRELGKGELWFLIPYHPEVIDQEMRIENGMMSPFVELVDATGPLVPVFSSYERAEEALRVAKVPANTYAAASMQAVLVLEVLSKMEIRGMLNQSCKTGQMILSPEMMRDVADGSAFQPEECDGEIVTHRLHIIDPADYPTDLLQPVFEILRQHRNFRAAWVLENGTPDGGEVGGRHFQFVIQMEPRDAAIYHDFNLVMASAAHATGHQADSGYVESDDEEYLASLWREVLPFYIAPDHEPPPGV